MLRAGIVVWGALIVGAIGAVIAFGARGDGSEFSAAQAQALTKVVPTVLTGSRVAAAIALQPQAVPAAERTPEVKTQCISHGTGTLRNPWVCNVRYRRGPEAHYLLAIEPNGSYTGVGTGTISGCCIKVPTLN
jgi:hypothetical protein